MTDLQALHQALSEAECGSRELDLRIATGVDGYTLEKRGKDRKEWLYHKDDSSGLSRRDPGPCSYGYNAMARYTTSLDAITSLIERVLPPIEGFSDKPSEGWKFGVGRGLVPGLWTGWMRKHAEDGVNKMAKTPALALCLALVSALIAQEGEK